MLCQVCSLACFGNYFNYTSIYFYWRWFNYYNEPDRYNNCISDELQYVTGQGGMLSFGHAVYMGIGGFVAVHVMNIVENESLWLPLPLLPLVGGLVGLGFATIIGSFSTRKAGTVFA